MRFRTFATVVGLAALLAPAASARSATTLGAIELEGLVTKQAVRDRVIEDGGRSMPARIERFTDAHGHQITIGTDIPVVDLDLSGYASVLGQTLHGAEMNDVFVEVVRWEVIEAVCGGAGAVGCYRPAQRWMTVTDRDPSGVNELVHTIVHEYGHHVDGYLENLGHLDAGCTGADGSRNWWWGRAPDSFRCYAVPWDRLIGELYAEDYTAAHGIVGWHLRTIGPPSAAVVNSIVYDFGTRFAPRTIGGSAVVPRRKAVTWPVTVKHWTWLTATLRGPHRAELDLYLFRRGARRPIKMSEKNGSVERIEHALRPGRYEIVAYAHRARGRGTVRLRLE